MTARCALITGGTGSLGRRTAELLALSRWTVIITGRAAAGTATAAQSIAARTGADVIGLPLDLTSLQQVRRFAAEPAGRDDPALVGRTRYTTSKLCNVLTAYELDRRLAAGEWARRASPPTRSIRV